MNKINTAYAQDRLIISPAEQRARYAQLRVQFWPQPSQPQRVPPVSPAPPPPAPPASSACWDHPPPFIDDADRLRWMLAAYHAYVAAHPKYRVTMAAVMIVGTKAFGVTSAALVSPSHAMPIVRYRQYLMCFARQVTPASAQQIGRMFCRDHTTVLYALRRHGSFVAAALRNSG